MLSKQALALVPQIRRNGFEQTVRFNIAIAQIGLGHLGRGKRLVEREIQTALDASNIVDAEDSLREYADALVAAHDWHAVDVLRRDLRMRDQLMTTVRQQALAELSAKFDAERRARQIDLLTRDNAIKGAALKADKLHQQLAGHTMRCTISIGYASFPLPGIAQNVSLGRAISLADEALYQAKRLGRNRACSASALLADSEAQPSSIKTDLGTAAERAI